MPDVMGKIEQRTVIKDRLQSFKDPLSRWQSEGGIPNMIINRVRKFGKHNVMLKQRLLGS